MKTKLKSGQIYESVAGHKRVIKQERLSNGCYTATWSIRDLRDSNPYQYGTYRYIANYIADMKFKFLHDPGMKKYRAKVYWQMCSEIEFFAKNQESADSVATCWPKLPEDATYVVDSFNVEPEDVVEIQY